MSLVTLKLIITYNKQFNKDKKQLAFCSLRSLILANHFLPVNMGVRYISQGVVLPLYRKQGNTYIGVLQCGSGLDAYLQIELSDAEVDEINYVELKPLVVSLSSGVSLDKIKESVGAGLELFFEKTGKSYNIKKVGYIPNDSTHYHLHTRIVFQLLERIYTGGEFKE